MRWSRTPDDMAGAVLFRTLATASAVTTAVVLAGCTAAGEDSGPTEAGVTIERILALSDGDHLATTYADGVLAPERAGYRDLLTTMSIRDGEVTSSEAEVSNSVTSAPEVLALAPDGGTAFVTERLGPRPAGASRADQLPAGTRLFAVDLTDGGIAHTATIAPAPEALAVHPGGRSVAVVSNTPESSMLQLVPWTPGGFGAPVSHDLADLGITGSAAGPRGEVLATNVQWHPSGRLLAVNITSQDRVAFFATDGTGPPLPWHSPIEVGTDPFVGRFTPDGRHYLTSDWGRDLDAPTLDTRLPREPSEISVIELGALGSAVPPRVIQSVATDRSAEGLAVSPDGTWVATVNMRGTALPSDSPAFDATASVTLLRRDVDTGTLTKIADHAFDAVLPEGGTFDPTGRYFLATSYQGGAQPVGGPGVQVFEVGPPEAPGLTAVQRIPLPHGVHHVVVG